MNRYGLLILMAVLGFGCGGGESESNSGAPSASFPVGTAAPFFSLPDLNSSSATSGNLVTPSDYNGTVCGWYFGHAD